MLAYAANRPRVGARQSSPNALLFVICAHIVVIAAIMSANMGLTPAPFDKPTEIFRVRLTPEPPPPHPISKGQKQRTPAVEPRNSHNSERVTNVDPRVPVDLGHDSGTVTAGGIDVVSIPKPPLLPIPLPISSAAQLLTPQADLRPPYPQSKLLSGEEASLMLRLTVDDQGRVVAVEPVGRVDPVFLAAARRHLMAHWRYKPAIQDGRAVSSSFTVALRFELNG
jgi:protein TonB